MKNLLYIICSAACLVSYEMTSASISAPAGSSEPQATADVVTPEIIQRIESERKANEVEREQIKAKRRMLENQIFAYNREMVGICLFRILDGYNDFLSNEEFREAMETVKDSDSQSTILKTILKFINKYGIPLAKDKLSIHEEEHLLEILKDDFFYEN